MRIHRGIILLHGDTGHGYATDIDDTREDSPKDNTR